jgi:hypothetical protein
MAASVARNFAYTAAALVAMMSSPACLVDAQPAPAATHAVVAPKPSPTVMAVAYKSPDFVSDIVLAYMKTQHQYMACEDIKKYILEEQTQNKDTAVHGAFGVVRRQGCAAQTACSVGCLAGCAFLDELCEPFCEAGCTLIDC